MSETAIALFTRDLRLSDNPVLAGAADARFVVPLFVRDAALATTGFAFAARRARRLAESLARQRRRLVHYDGVYTPSWRRARSPRRAATTTRCSRRTTGVGWPRRAERCSQRHAACACHRACRRRRSATCQGRVRVVRPKVDGWSAGGWPAASRTTTSATTTWPPTPPPACRRTCTWGVCQRWNWRPRPPQATPRVAWRSSGNWPGAISTTRCWPLARMRHIGTTGPVATPGGTTRTRWRPGSRDRRGSRSWTPGCGSCVPRDGCTTGHG